MADKKYKTSGGQVCNNISNIILKQKQFNVRFKKLQTGFRNSHISELTYFIETLLQIVLDNSIPFADDQCH